ncbi:MAG TPA: 6-phosphogluconolactonase [Candidatus Limnocylindrales bacterium]
MSGERLEILPDPEACAHAAAELIAGVLAEAAAARGSAHWATTGGSTPAAIYRELAVAPHRDEVPWEHVHLWWGDERFVPADHPQSNAHIATSDLIGIGALSGESGTGGSGADVFGRREAGAPIHPDHVHPIPTGAAIAADEGPDWAAARYAEELAAAGPAVADGMPVFDLVIVGVGPDGHVLSVFPGSATFDRGETVLGVPAPTHIEPHLPRVTLNPRALGVARQIVVVAHGAAKAEMLASVLGPDVDERRWPAQLARREGATWFVDEAAASALRR